MAFESREGLRTLVPLRRGCHQRTGGVLRVGLGFSAPSGEIPTTCQVVVRSDRMATELPEETFLALACIIRADGRLAKNETEGLRRAAQTYGLSDEATARLMTEAAETQLGSIVWPEMSTWQKALTYAFASWVARADGSVSRDEHEQLAALCDALGLSKLRRDAARSAMYDIAALPGGNRPDQFDFAALEEKLQEKLPGSFKDHTAPD